MRSRASARGGHGPRSTHFAGAQRLARISIGKREDPLAGAAPAVGPGSSARRIPAATSSGSCESIRTPASPTTSGIAVTFITTGTQPASIASATARPKPSCRDACTYTAARR